MKHQKINKLNFSLWDGEELLVDAVIVIVVVVVVVVDVVGDDVVVDLKAEKLNVRFADADAHLTILNDIQLNETNLSESEARDR